MADIFYPPGSSSAAVSVPLMAGAYLPNIDGVLALQTRGYRVPWGGAALMSRLSYEAGAFGGEAPAAQGGTGLGSAIADIMTPLVSFFQQSADLLVGPQGPPGLQGPPGAYVVGDIGALGFQGTDGADGVDGADGADGADGEDAFANIDLPIGYDGFEGAFTSDSPSAGFVSWASFKIKYQGVDYTVAADAVGTSDAFIYWDQNSTPTTLQHTSTLTTATGLEKWILCVNNGGTAEPAQFIKALNAGVLQAGTIIADKIAANAIETSKLNGLAVTTAKIADGAATSEKSATTAAATGFTNSDYTAVQTASSFVSYGGAVRLTAQVDFKSDSGAGDTVGVRIRRDGTTTVWAGTQGISNAYKSYLFTGIDVPGSGTYDYTLEVQGVVDDGDAQNRTLLATETRK